MTHNAQLTDITAYNEVVANTYALVVLTMSQYNLYAREGNHVTFIPCPLRALAADMRRARVKRDLAG